MTAYGCHFVIFKLSRKSNVCHFLKNRKLNWPPRQGQKEQLQQLTMVLLINKHQLYVHHAFFVFFLFSKSKLHVPSWCLLRTWKWWSCGSRYIWFLVLWNLRGHVWDHPIGSCERSGSFYCMPFTSLRCSWHTHRRSPAGAPVVEAIWLYSLYRRFRVSATLATQSSRLQTLLFTVKYRKS